MAERAIEALLAAAENGGVDCGPLQVQAGPSGFDFETPDHAETGASEVRLRSVAAGDPYVLEWYHWERTVEGHGTARRRFLRWLEAADERAPPARREALAEGVTRTWGELRIEIGLDGSSSGRVYEIRHVEDEDEPLGNLTVHEEPLAARELVKHDDDGRYRPLKTAPSLPHGFAFIGLDSRDVIETIEFIYPATIANWDRERNGDLDVAHYRETAERQTGIYDLIDELPKERVADLAAACCVDSQCLKRREWDESAEEPLEVPRGDGEFPCREPCSLVVAAARKLTVLEGETPREYTFELTPSEKNQLEELIEAVADDRLDEIREADLGDGANRYRARYLRAKRMQDGNL
ncbi:MAG: DR2241 family protein, partial [Halobacteriaceae archaeon]